MTVGNLTNTNLDYQAGIITRYLIAGSLCTFGLFFVQFSVLCLLLHRIHQCNIIKKYNWSLGFLSDSFPTLRDI